MLWAALVLLLAAVAVALLYPLWWRTSEPLPAGLEGTAAEQDLADEKRRLLNNLRRLREDRAEGRVAEADFDNLEAEYLRQIAGLMDELERRPTAQAIQAQPAAPRRLFHRMGSLVLLLLLAAPVPYYYYRMLPAADEQAGRTSLEGALQQLEKKLADHPDNAEGWMLAARSYEAMGRPAEALNAWSKVLTLQPENREAMFNLALALIQSDNTGARQKGLEYFDTLLKAEPDAPALLWYKGTALFSLERKKEARDVWLRLQAILPPGSENAELVKEALKRAEQKN